MSLTINTDSDTLIGFGKDVLVNVGKELWKFVKSKEGVALIGGLIGGTGVGVTASTKKGRELVSKAWNIVRDELSKLPKGKVAAVAKKAASACAKKLATGAVAVGGAIVAGYVTGLTVGDYLKGDAKNFFKQFGQDLALNLTLTPVASAVKHIVQNKDMVVEDIQSNVIKPLANTLKKIGQKIGIVSKDKKPEDTSEPKELSVSRDLVNNVSQTGEPNKVSAYTGFNYDEMAAKLGLSSRPANPQAENQWKKEVEKQMRNKNYKGNGANTNSPEWYFQGLANKILGTNLTWTGIKDTNTNYDFVSAVGLRVALTMPTENRLLHSQAIANTNIEFQALRGKNTGAYNYGEEDVWSYNIAISSLIAVCRYIGKVLAMNNSFDVQVAKLPVHLLSTVFGYTAAQSIYNDVIANKPNYITRLNSLIKELNTYAYKGRTLNSRWNYLADKCIKDFNGDKAIYGVYNLKIVPTLNAAGNIAYQTLTSFTSIGDYLDYVQQQLDRLRTTKIVAGSSVYVKIAGDMIKLLGATSKTFDNCPYFTGQEVLKFEYDAEANDQLRNAKLVTLTGIGTAPSYDRLTPMDASWDLQGNTSVTFSLASLAKTYYEKTETIIISDRNKEFQAKDNLQMIQFQCTMERHNSGASTGPQYHLKDIGTSLLCDVRVITYGTGSAPVDHDFTGFISIADANYLKVNGYTTLYGTSANNYSEWITWLSQIDFMPRMQLCKITASTTDFFNDFLDVDNYAYMTNSQFTMLNNVATYSQTFTFLPDAVKIIGLIAS